MTIVTVRHADRPELWDRIPDLFSGVWPEYNLHGNVMEIYWTRLFEQFSQFQLVLYDDRADDILAASRSIPLYWDGTQHGLGTGLDAAIVAGFSDHEAGTPPNTLCALGIEIPPRHQGKRFARLMLREMVRATNAAGCGHLTVPLRPTWKERYPLTPIERYIRWTRDDGSPFDPWLRAHVQEGGVIATPIPESSRITGTIAEWESWTRMRFPDDGRYVIPGGLATVHIDHGRDLGSYWEPNVWVVHAATADSPGPHRPG